MTEMDQSVERVLAGLREAEVPIGMEERVLRAVTARESARVPKLGWWPEWLRGGGASRVAALALMAVVLVGLMGYWASRHRTGDRSVASLGSLPGPRAAAAAQDVVMRPATRRRSRAGGTTGVGEARSSGGKEMDSLAVSFPAPPLPLTEQERLLLQVVHGHDPVQVAMLDGVSSFQKFAEEKVEFQKFFQVTPIKAAPETKAQITGTGEEKR